MTPPGPAALRLTLALCLLTVARSHADHGPGLPEEEEERGDDTATVTTGEDEGDPEDLEVFYPTRQWQPLLPGRAVPAGSHVRLNLQTGEREAKLQDEEPGPHRPKERRQGPRLGKMDLGPGAYTSQDLKHALARFKEGLELGTPKDDQARRAEVRRRFRPIEELKREFEALNLHLETDLQIMVRLIDKFNSSGATLGDKVAALKDLEYYVHQVDNARDLLTFGGLQLVMGELNSTEPVLKEHAAFVLGAALSSNPKVQVEAIEGGALQKLLLLLATEQPLAVKKKALFALSSLLRHFPHAQLRFLKLGGLQALRNLARDEATRVLAVRVVTLLHDLLAEKLSAEEEASASEVGAEAREKAAQYARVPLVAGLVEQGWCAVVAGLLGRQPDHDPREKVLRALGLLLDFCRDAYRHDSGLGATLARLRDEYSRLAARERRRDRRDGDREVEEEEEEEEAGYFQEMLSTIRLLLRRLD
ncbi:nucleotide exchange factor SIL1 [Ornithorhynchus anatinus]|uniref:Nucleotide exchange factor SIL1 n=1 Tax=Ornithorhynchus anatinus TaxID=9258 RepID=A0A6I8NQS1_ORNAN|nr:nucleotide exchange factor SIL1 [Ornithorhynchus anatinus]XP_028908785.1 nucleotide exchange factor SIL1 [Ornithorhynchus anatinus]XP_039766414.1 nucleotide exchange factor SIL1 [Ornithorhynchus anatinus]